MKRLAFIKYLHTVAIQQSDQPEPLSSASILTFHDSIELFLQLASEINGINTKNVNFIDYWDLLNPKLMNNELSQKESMKRLNNARVSLKHHGTMPSKLNIEGFRVNSIDFFQENAPLVFGINFEDISLIDLINCSETKNALQEATQLIKDNQLDNALDKIALAFEYLINDYENRKRTQYGRSPFFFGSVALGGSHWRQIDSYLSQFIDDVKVSLENMQEAIKILSLGLDYRRYVKFRLIAPRVSRVISGKYIFHRVEKQTPTSKEDVRFCFDFVIDSAINLQEFDFNIN